MRGYMSNFPYTVFTILIAIFTMHSPNARALDAIVAKKPDDLTKNARDESRIELNSTIPVATMHTGFESLKPFLKIRQVQSSDLTGIRLTIAIINGGKQAVQFKNPLDFLNVHLMDVDGWPIALPSVVRRQDGDWEGSTGDRIRLPFKVDKVILNKRLLSTKEIEAKNITLPANGNLQFFCIVDTAANRAEDKPTNPSDMAPVPLNFGPIQPGKYKVSVQLTFFASKLNEYRRSIESDCIDVQLLIPTSREITSLKRSKK